jgi:DNA-binding PadR family transcriptional regulator
MPLVELYTVLPLHASTDSAVPRKPNSSQHFKRLIAELASRRNEWVHGYDLLTSLGMKSGTLYPLLIRLHDQGYVESRWITREDDGRPRHAYRLTRAGAAAAAALAEPRTRLRPGQKLVPST